MTIIPFPVKNKRVSSTHFYVTPEQQHWLNLFFKILDKPGNMEDIVMKEFSDLLEYIRRNPENYGLKIFPDISAESIKDGLKRKKRRKFIIDFLVPLGFSLAAPFILHILVKALWR